MTRNVGYGTGGRRSSSLPAAGPAPAGAGLPAPPRLPGQHLPPRPAGRADRGRPGPARGLPTPSWRAVPGGRAYSLLLPTVPTPCSALQAADRRPEGSIAALVATALVPLAADDPGRYASLAALLALLVGACFLVARVIRLGWVADYFSRAVLIGYLHGVAVVLIISQLAKLLGLDIDARDPLAQLAEVVRELPGLHGTTVVVGALCLASLLLLRWRLPKLPGALLVVVAAIAASAALGLASEGVATVGEIPSGLPGLACHEPSATCSPVPARWGSFRQLPTRS